MKKIGISVTIDVELFERLEKYPVLNRSEICNKALTVAIESEERANGKQNA